MVQHVAQQCCATLLYEVEALSTLCNKEKNLRTVSGNRSNICSATCNATLYGPLLQSTGENQQTTLPTYDTEQPVLSKTHSFIEASLWGKR